MHIHHNPHQEVHIHHHLEHVATENDDIDVKLIVCTVTYTTTFAVNHDCKQFIVIQTSDGI